MTRAEQKAKLQETIRDLNNSSEECLRACSDLRVIELEDMCAELKNALAEANDSDAAAEGYNASNFSSKRAEYDNLTTRAGKLLSGISNQ